MLSRWEFPTPDSPPLNETRDDMALISPHGADALRPVIVDAARRAELEGEVEMRVSKGGVESEEGGA